MKAHHIIILMPAILFLNFLCARGQDCAPAPLPFIDNFDSPTLDSCWYWLREDPTHWSLSERPGFMRIHPFSDAFCCPPSNMNRNTLLRFISNGDWTIETKVRAICPPIVAAEIIVYLDNNNWLVVGQNDWAGVRTHRMLNGAFDYTGYNGYFSPETYFRLTKHGNLFTAFYSGNGSTWQALTTWQHDPLANAATISVGLTAADWEDANENADYDYFRVMRESPPCSQITPIPFIDHFDSPTLDSCWQWNHTPPDPNQISLTNHSSWVQINCPRPSWQEPGLYRMVADGDMIIEAKMDRTDGNPCMDIFIENGNCMPVSWAPSIQNIRAHSYYGGGVSYIDYHIEADTVYLQYRKIGTLYGVYCSTDGRNWSYITTWNRQMAVNGKLKVGVGAVGNSCEWDYFRIGNLSDTVLAVELLAFTALPSSDGIRLSFATASETSNDFFEVLRGASQAGAFSRIATLLSQGNSATEQRYEYLDREVMAGETYWYYLADVDMSGTRTEHREMMRSATMTVTAALPEEYSLTAYPNPFNPTTTISFALPEAGWTQITAYDVNGRLVRTLVNDKHDAGKYSVTFDARDLPSGVYLIRLNCKGFGTTHKAVLLK